MVPERRHSPVIAVVGPTASGKSNLAIALAQSLDGEVLSADSMQIYEGMNIGTGKIDKSATPIKHYGLDIVSPGEPYSAALYQTYARSTMESIETAGKQCILCGGTGFYVRAAIDDYDFPEGEQQGNSVRDYWNAYAETHGSQKLWEQLNAKDPESAALIPPKDTKRIVRSFELLESGHSYASQKENLQAIAQIVPAYFLGLALSPETLNQRINRRVDAMIEEGLVAEVETLLDQGFREGLCAPAAIGYKEIVAYLDGQCTLDQAIEAIKQATRRYGKRQRTWFRKDQRIHWLDAEKLNPDELCAFALKAIDRMKLEDPTGLGKKFSGQ